VNVKTVDDAGRDGIAQPLQGRPDQRGSAVAVIDEAVIRLQAEPLLDDARLQGGDLAGDGAAGLRVRRDTRINGHTQGRHDYLRVGVDTWEGPVASSDDTEEAGRQRRRWIDTICS
jgi:hypothetical protein